jgi:hypothetical protein
MLRSTCFAGIALSSEARSERMSFATCAGGASVIVGMAGLLMAEGYAGHTADVKRRLILDKRE